MYQMASFGPLQSSGGVASSNFDFTYLSIHANIALVCQYSSPKTPGLCYMKKVKEIRRRSKTDKKIEEEKEKEEEEVEGAIGEPELV